MGKAVKINITLPEEALSKINEYTHNEKTTRSGLILRAIESYMKKKEEDAAEERRRTQIKKASSEIRRLRAKSGAWDGVAEIRKWRDTK